ncbi:MAG: hypothetical protein KDN19_04850 [Verrucomicrobiae bacterium]|nr:hypothetical protein [Verrucomicrobiae bacterium]
MIRAIRAGMVAAFGPILLASCTTTEGLHYKDVFESFSLMKVPTDELEYFPLFLVDSGTGEPVSGAKFIVETEPEPISLEGDRIGQVLVPVKSELFKRDPPLRIEPDGVSVQARFNMEMEGHVRSVQLRSASEMECVGDSRVAVFFEGDDERYAHEVLLELRRARRIVGDTLGLEPITWAVIVESHEQEKGILYLTIPAVGYDSTWRCFREEWTSGEFMDVNVHEWTESTLTSRISTLYDDPRNRFIGDGLAEFATWKACGLLEDYGERLSIEQLGDRQTVDLLSEFRVIPGKILSRRKLDRGVAKYGFSPGYALAFAFWHELVEQYGADLPARLVEQLAEKPKVGADEALVLLEELTGDESIRDRVRSVDVAAARERIERLIP